MIQFSAAFDLGWQRVAGEVGNLSCAREFGLVSVKGIREVIYTLRKNSSISLVNGNDMRSKRHHEVWDGVTRWEAKFFYVDRIFSDVLEKFDEADVNENKNLVEN